MAFQKGNKLGGRKTMEEEMEVYKEKIKQESLEELATRKVFGCLGNIGEEKVKDIKDIALPVYLKSKADKKEVKQEVKIEGINYITPDETNDKADS